MSNVAPLFDVGLDFEFNDAAEVFDKVRTLIRERYYSNEIDDQALYWAAIQGMLRHISPPSNPTEARIWTAAEYERVLNSLRGQRKSIGILTHFDPRDASLTVTTVTPGSPADGVLQVHDRIMRINGERLGGKRDTEIDALLRSDAAPLRLTVVRDISIFDTEIVAAEHRNPSVESGLLPEQVGYLRLRRITKDVATEIAPKLRAWAAQGVNRLVLDLRNNGGGVFIEGLRVAELFVPKGHVLLQTVREGEPLKRYVSSNESPLDMRIAILANDGTASSAESLTAALATNGKAQIVGVKTFGKSTIDKTYTLDNGMRVRIISGAMYTSGGHTWHERGLAPTIEVAGQSAQVQKWLESALAQRFTLDRQLAGAWQLLRQAP